MKALKLVDTPPKESTPVFITVSKGEPEEAKGISYDHSVKLHYKAMSRKEYKELINEMNKSGIPVIIYPDGTIEQIRK